MTLNGKPYIRRKGDKFIIELKAKKKDGTQTTKYLKTLPPAIVVYYLVCQDAMVEKASQMAKEKGLFGVMEFGQSILTEPLGSDENKTLTPKEKAEMLSEWSK